MDKSTLILNKNFHCLNTGDYFFIKYEKERIFFCDAEGNTNPDTNVECEENDSQKYSYEHISDSSDDENYNYHEYKILILCNGFIDKNSSMIGGYVNKKKKINKYILEKEVPEEKKLYILQSKNNTPEIKCDVVNEYVKKFNYVIFKIVYTDCGFNVSVTDTVKNIEVQPQVSFTRDLNLETEQNQQNNDYESIFEQKLFDIINSHNLHTKVNVITSQLNKLTKRINNLENESEGLKRKKRFQARIPFVHPAVQRAQDYQMIKQMTMWNQ